MTLSPWPLVLLGRQHPGVPVAVLNESRRVLYASPEAREAGVQTGMREIAALSRCPELHAEMITAPAAIAAWAEVLETLYARYSDRVEGRVPGTVFLKISASAARELGAALHAPVGLAESLEVAQLAALRARPGEVRDVDSGSAEKAFLALTPAAHLEVIGLTPAHIERLAFLGVRGLADLMKWSAAQREAFLGVDVGRRVNRFLRGERTKVIQKYVPGRVIEARMDLDAPLHEPAEAEVVLGELLPPILAELRGRAAAYLTVHAQTLGGQLSATRKVKGSPGPAGLLRIASLALSDTDALPLGVETLVIQLSGLQQPGRMVGLWASLAELEVTKDVLDRFPEALVKVQWLDPYAYATDACYQWVDWLTGTVRCTPMTPRQSWKPAFTRTQAHQKAVERTLAFFEGAQL
ncbi:Y-family DNA polymerase [Deinococcus humi]|uniref:Protein ImuB n=1 Tax=Deinococcus humi TaxID=662880 RepID=A0A7W8NHZ3_9DEIO|nr:protein ImuB [Deinococcus humi]